MTGRRDLLHYSNCSNYPKSTSNTNKKHKFCNKIFDIGVNLMEDGPSDEGLALEWRAVKDKTRSCSPTHTHSRNSWRGPLN